MMLMMLWNLLTWDDWAQHGEGRRVRGVRVGAVLGVLVVLRRGRVGGVGRRGGGGRVRLGGGLARLRHHVGGLRGRRPVVVRLVRLVGLVRRMVRRPHVLDLVGVVGVGRVRGVRRMGRVRAVGVHGDGRLPALRVVVVLLQGQGHHAAALLAHHPHHLKQNTLSAISLG